MIIIFQSQRVVFTTTNICNIEKSQEEKFATDIQYSVCQSKNGTFDTTKLR